MYLLGSVIFLTVAGILAFRIYWSRPVVFLGKGIVGPYAQRIRRTLDQASPESTQAPEGLVVPLFRLRSTSGATTRVIAAEGKFTDQAILSPATYTQHFKKLFETSRCGAVQITLASSAG